MKLKNNKSVTQSHPMGCGVACVAYVLNKSYIETLKLFTNPEAAYSNGYYCEDLIEALNRENRKYEYRICASLSDEQLKSDGVIVFCAPCPQYPFGHYLTKTEGGWMNPWINCPVITPAKSGFVAKPPSDPAWIIYPAGN